MTKRAANKPSASAEAVWRLIGLATRARKLQTGADAAAQALRRDNAFLVIVALDIAENSGTKIVRQCENAGVPIRHFGTKDELGQWTGHDERAVAVIQDAGFAGRIAELIDALHHDKSTLGG